MQALPLAEADVTTPQGAAVYQQCDQAIKARHVLAADGNGLGGDTALVALYVDVDGTTAVPAPGPGALAHYRCTPACRESKSRRIPLRSVQVVPEHVHAKQGSESRHIEITGVPGYGRLVLRLKLERGKTVNLGRLVLKRAGRGAGNSPE